MKQLIVVLFALIVALTAGLAAVLVLRPQPGPATALEQPAPQTQDAAQPRRISLPVFLALVCVFNLSLVALLGSLALRRRIERISPEK